MKIDIYNPTFGNNPIPSMDSSPLSCYRDGCKGEIGWLLEFDIDQCSYNKLNEEMKERGMRFDAGTIDNDSGWVKILIGCCEKAEPLVLEVYERMKSTNYLSFKDLDTLQGHYDY